MPPFSSRSLLALAALFGASVVSGFNLEVQAYAKPMIVRRMGWVKIRFDAVMTDMNFRRRLGECQEKEESESEHRKLEAPDTIEFKAFFCNSAAGCSPPSDAEAPPEGRQLHLKFYPINSPKWNHGDADCDCEDDLQYINSSLWPNYMPKVQANITEVGPDANHMTYVTWTIPTKSIVKGKKYTFTLKLRVGPHVQSGTTMYVDFLINAENNLGQPYAAIIVK